MAGGAVYFRVRQYARVLLHAWRALGSRERLAWFTTCCALGSVHLDLAPPTAPSTIIGSPHVVIVARVSVAVIASPRRMNAPSPRPSRRARGTRMREAGSLFSSVRGFLPAPPPAGGPDAS